MNVKHKAIIVVLTFMCTSAIVVSIPLSFVRTISWIDYFGSKKISLSNGTLIYIDYETSSETQKHRLHNGFPWYKKFAIEDSGAAKDVDWSLFIYYQTPPVTLWINFPLYLLLIVLLPTTLYLVLPYIKNRHHHWHNLCMKIAHEWKHLHHLFRIWEGNSSAIRKTIIVLLTVIALGFATIRHVNQPYNFGYASPTFQVQRNMDHIDIMFLELKFVATMGWYCEHGVHHPDIYLPKIYRFSGKIEVIEIPIWMPFVIFAYYPTIVFIRGPFRRWRRGRKGLCIQCGYNLKGNTTGVCSECGTEIIA